MFNFPFPYNRHSKKLLELIQRTWQLGLSLLQLEPIVSHPISFCYSLKQGILLRLTYSPTKKDEAREQGISALSILYYHVLSLLTMTKGYSGFTRFNKM